MQMEVLGYSIMLVLFTHLFIRLRKLEMSTNGMQKQSNVSYQQRLSSIQVLTVHLLESVGSNDKSNSNTKCEGTAGSKV